MYEGGLLVLSHVHLTALAKICRCICNLHDHVQFKRLCVNVLFLACKHNYQLTCITLMLKTTVFTHCEVRSVFTLCLIMLNNGWHCVGKWEMMLLTSVCYCIKHNIQYIWYLTLTKHTVTTYYTLLGCHLMN